MVQRNKEVCDVGSHGWNACSRVHVICELQLLCVYAITELTGQIQVVAPHKSVFIMDVDEATKDVLKKIFHKPSLSEFRLSTLPAVITIMSKVTPQGITHIQQTLHTLYSFICTAVRWELASLLPAPICF